MSHLELQNVTKVYPGEVTGLKDFSLDIQPGELIVVVGPSGCGKSTLLRLIAGLEEVTSGNMSLCEKVINELPPKNRNIAMMFQNYVLFPHLTVFENMAFGLKLRKVKKAEINRRVFEVAEILKISDLLHRYPKALSGGQQQRAALGRAVLRQPEVFLLDEPLSNLDAKMRTQMRMEISRLHKNLGATMILVTHDQTEAMTMGDRIVVLKDGIIQQVADPVTVYNKPVNRFVAGFIGTPAMNLLNGTMTHKEGKCFFQHESFNLEICGAMGETFKSFTGREMVFGIRPEGIEVTGMPTSSDTPPTGNTLVEVVEHMGSHAFLYLEAGKESLVVKVPVEHHYTSGQEVTFSFNTGNFHFFDADTGEAVFP